MIKKVEPTKVTDIFPIEGKVIYEIPKYQREYTWGVNDWDALFNDLMENEEGYFLGSYICVTDSSLACPSLDVIDGQQRFTNDDYQALLWHIAGSGATRESITKQQVESLNVILPPLTMQNEFSDFVAHVQKNKEETQKRIDFFKELLAKKTDELFNGESA